MRTEIQPGAVAVNDDGAAGSELDSTFAGLDALDLGGAGDVPRVRRFWSAAWPKAAALVVAVGVWQLIFVSGWKEPYQFESPEQAFQSLRTMFDKGTILTAIRITMLRALKGFGIAVLIGVGVGALLSRFKVLRTAIGSLITGLMTMPSIAWFPLAILLFKISEGAIMFVVVLGAAPAIANGLISGVDQIPPILLRAGRVLGATGLSSYRHIILPASLPSFMGGLKQGWAFAWRSLMAGELLVIIPGAPSVGFLLQTNRDLHDVAGLMATMIVILVIGIAVDALLFGYLDKRIRQRWGLVDEAT